MTLTMAWVRQIRGIEELVIASDSRLRWGQAWDACPKIFRTSRGDTVLGFAGDTMYSYPLILQAINHIQLHRASRDRVTDLHELKGHLSRLFSSMLGDLKDFKSGKSIYDTPDTLFIMAGYSWRNKSYDMWKVRYDISMKTFVWQKAGGLQGAGGKNRLVIIGHPYMSDRSRNKAKKQKKVPEVPREDDIKIMANQKIAKLVKQRGGLSNRGFDMEPFEVLRDMLRKEESTSIGGAPQLMKVYPSCTSQTIGVLWPDKASKKVAVSGRNLLPYERLNIPVIDPDTLEIGIDLWPERTAY